MKKRFNFILFILIICLVFSSCVNSTALVSDTKNPEESAAVKTADVPAASPDKKPVSSPSQSYSAIELSSKSPEELLKIKVAESDYQTLYNTLRDFQLPEMFGIYAKETDAGVKGTILKNIVFVCENTDRYYQFIDSTSLTTADLENMEEVSFKIIVSHHFDTNTEMVIRKLDKEKLWNKLYPFLITGDSDTASLIGQLNYPEYSDRVQAFLKSGNPHVNDLTFYLQPDSSVSEPSPTPSVSAPPAVPTTDTSVDYSLAGLGYKKAGKSGGPIDSIIIIKYYKDYDGKFTSDISNYSGSLVSSDKLGSTYDPGLNAVIYIKETYSYGGKYKFKTLHKIVKGYRVGYKIVVADLRTKRILVTKTLKARKLPKLIYSNELADDGRYYTTPPSDDKIESVLKSLLKGYGCLSEY
jgi:hypothetical protein